LLVISTSALADQDCAALSKFVGTYKLVSSTCKGPFGDTLTVAPYTETGESSYSGYRLTTGGIEIGPSTSANSTDKCTVSGNSVTVQTCAFDGNCLPKYWTYSFSESNVSFQANGCEAQFTKAN